MSCRACENDPKVTYVRVGPANVEIAGCEEHLGQLIEQLRAGAPGRDDNVTRFEVIDHTEEAAPVGRIVVKYDVRVERNYQDDGRTLKVFLRDRGSDG